MLLLSMEAAFLLTLFDGAEGSQRCLKVILLCGQRVAVIGAPMVVVPDALLIQREPCINQAASMLHSKWATTGEFL